MNIVFYFLFHRRFYSRLCVRFVLDHLPLDSIAGLDRDSAIRVRILRHPNLQCLGAASICSQIRKCVRFVIDLQCARNGCCEVRKFLIESLLFKFLILNYIFKICLLDSLVIPSVEHISLTSIQTMASISFFVLSIFPASVMVSTDGNSSPLTAYYLRFISELS